MDQTLHYTLTPDDFADFARHCSRAMKTFPTLPAEKPARASFSNTMLGYALILGLTLLVFLYFHKSPAPAHAAAPASAPAPTLIDTIIHSPFFFLGLFLLFFSYILIRNRFFPNGKAFLQKYPDLVQPHTVHITDDTITISAPTSESRYDWSHFAHFFETPRLFLFLNTSKAAHIFPKSAFPNPAAISAFRSLAETNIRHTPGAFPITPLQPSQPGP